MSYGPDLASIWRLGAHYTDQLLRGAKAAELPVQQRTKFELVLNSKDRASYRKGATRPCHASWACALPPQVACSTIAGCRPS